MNTALVFICSWLAIFNLNRVNSTKDVWAKILHSLAATLCLAAAIQFGARL